jgi:D-alanyl-lipoteichoic acid acyltransferase DltB (MBOAT superfamily)
MFVSGIWHGANWTFILWGIYHGILQVLNIIKRKISFLDYGEGGPIVKVLEVILIFILSMFGWIFFRANSVGDVWLAFEKIFTQPGLLYNGEGKPSMFMFLSLIAILMFKELKDELNLKINFIHNKNFVISSISTALMIILILLCAKFEGGQFIYFQF